MPAFWEALTAAGIGLGIAAALVGLFAVTAWLAERRADRDLPKFLSDLERQQGEQPWNTV